MNVKKRWLPYSLMVLVLLAAAWLRLWRLADLPPGFYRDEAYNAMDALWMWESRTPVVYFAGNTGRHVLSAYLGAAFMAVWGARPYVIRLATALANILAVALLYRWGLALFRGERRREWLALVAAMGLAFSFWHVVMSRTAYEVALLVPVMIPVLSLFWSGWRGRSLWRLGVAGFLLGLSQYIYHVARLLPLVMALFVLLWTGLAYARRKKAPPEGVKWAWVGLLVMGGVSLVAFLPFGLFILNDPETFFFQQLITGLRTLIDSSSPTWRHNIVGESGFHWAGSLGFWLGLVVVLGRVRRPAYLFLLVGLLVMWLPAFLSEGFSTLRMAGTLPFYYLVMAVGWLAPVGWVARRWPRPALERGLPLALAGLFFVAGGSSTAYDYFVRWANEPEVYRAYTGPRTDLARQVIRQAQTADVLLPFETYAYPTVRFMLHDHFQEVSTPPPSAGRPAVMVQERGTAPSSLVWLTQDGLAYVTRPQLPSQFFPMPNSGPARPLVNPYTGETIADFVPFEGVEPLLPYLANWEGVKTVDYDWGHQVRLAGYEVWPPVVRAGQSPLLTLYWRSITGQPPVYTNFIQLVNGREENLAQWTDSALAYEHRWRPGGLTPQQHMLWLDPELPPGPYLVRMGLLNPATTGRVPVYTAAGEPFGDHLFLGLFYVAAAGTDPRLPPIPHPAHLGERITLLGFSEPRPAGEGVAMRLYWQALEPVGADYTAFVQLIDRQGHRVTGWDAQPLAGQYPTSLWQPGEVVVDEFRLPLPESLPPGEYRLITGLYEPTSLARLPAFDESGQPWPDKAVVLATVSLP